jgi:hypothetical protein
MKERKNRTKKIRGVKKVSINLLSLTFSMIKSFPIALLADHTQKIADKGWRCGQEEVREDKLAVLTLSIFGLFRTVSFAVAEGFIVMLEVEKMLPVMSS